jgi:hypothetical protein
MTPVFWDIYPDRPKFTPENGPDRSADGFLDVNFGRFRRHTDFNRLKSSDLD